MVLASFCLQVDRTVREQLEKLAAATDAARLALREWELPEALDALGPANRSNVPAAALADVESVQSAGGLAHLQVGCCVGGVGVGAMLAVSWLCGTVACCLRHLKWSK